MILFSFHRKAKRFLFFFEELEKVQKEYLLSSLKKNSNTIYGNKYGFHKIRSISEYQQNVPITTYEDYKEYIEEIQNGKQNVLTKDRVLLFEISSGTTSNSKLIPYTKSLKQEFQLGIAPWMYDLYSKKKNLSYGKSYWSITPSLRNRGSGKSIIPVGFEEDSEYIGGIQKFLVERLFATPKEIKYVPETFVFRYLTLLFLLKERDLSLISVWNPSFLTLLLEPLREYQTYLLDDLEKGKLHFSDYSDKKLVAQILFKLGKNKKRSEELKRILNSDWKEFGEISEKIWPNLHLISCWGDGNSKQGKQNLSLLFPQVEIQEKGLLATEGIVSIPLLGVEGKVLAYLSHFFEFEQNGNIKLAHELEIGKEYSVLITTGGGFYRYKLNDIVKVTGFLKKTPLFSFIRKEDTISDYFGEKLNESFVTKILNDTFQFFQIQPDFYMLAPEEENSVYFYTLFIECKTQSDYSEIQKIIEEKLNTNFHYNYCRKLGQLKELRIFTIFNSSHQDYLIGCQEMNQKLGNIKPVILHTKTGWKNRFKGTFC